MSDIEFLYHERYNEAIRAMIEDPSDLRIAVSYWGKRINEKLGLIDRLKERRNNIKVICDLNHIACRHEPIEQLINCGIAVRRIEGIHAKVWQSTSQLIVGSANSSRTALHFKDQGINPNEEAGVSISDVSMVKKAQNWFDCLWENSDTCFSVGPDDIARKIRIHSESVRAHARKAAFRCPPIDHQQRNEHFSYFVGDNADSAFRDRLKGLEMTPNENNWYSIRYGAIDDVEAFADELADALRDLICTACHVDRSYSKYSPLIPESFLSVSNEARRLISEHISNLVEENEGSYLWVKEGEGKVNLGHSLRLQSDRTCGEGLSLLTINHVGIKTAGDRPVKR